MLVDKFLENILKGTNTCKWVKGILNCFEQLYLKIRKNKVLVSYYWFVLPWH